VVLVKTWDQVLSDGSEIYTKTTIITFYPHSANPKQNSDIHLDSL
jgi:hypothetical protein